jgi:protein-S-isoprenylcysteine O-methyltransferase Ste14
MQSVVSIGLWLAALFGGAGTLRWTRGWLYVAVSLAAFVAVRIVVRRVNPAVLEARAKWRRGDTESYDKVFLAIFALLYFLQPMVAGMDAVRFGWSSIPFQMVYPGLALCALGSTVVVWTLAVNPHAESTVRIQTDRGHTVISTGPYRFVRHPMYAGIILGYVGGPLVLGSMWAAALSGLSIALFVVRTWLEDGTLSRELPGYKEYSLRTRYRLAPGLW